MASFEHHKMADCLFAQAALCERIADACAHETIAVKFKRLARDCRDAAVKEQTEIAKAAYPSFSHLADL